MIIGSEVDMKYELFRKQNNCKLRRNYRIIIGADFVPTESNKGIFETGNVQELFGKELSKILLESDLKILNLEVPITNCTKKITKEGSPNLKTYPEILNILCKMQSVLLSGANNHIYDYSQKGIEDTLLYLNNSGIEHVGFGVNKQEASKPWIRKYDGITIGVYSCSENEFCCADSRHGGGNGYDPLDTFDEIRMTKEKCDFLIVLYHGGRENYRYPSVGLKRICVKMAESGADLVICQHSHCVGTYEVYDNSLIVYGQGNLLFDYNQAEEWQTGILMEIELHKNDIVYNAIPIEKQREKVRLSDKLGEQIILQMKERSERINDLEFLKKQYHDFCQKQENILLLRGVMGINNKGLLAVNKVTKGKILDWMMSKRHRLLLMNYIKCESIREAILDLLTEED